MVSSPPHAHLGLRPAGGYPVSCRWPARGLIHLRLDRRTVSAGLAIPLPNLSLTGPNRANHVPREERPPSNQEGETYLSIDGGCPNRQQNRAADKEGSFKNLGDEKNDRGNLDIRPSPCFLGLGNVDTR